MAFIDSVLENISEPIYALTFVFALWRFKNYFDTPLKFFPVIILYTLLTEILGYFVANYPNLFSLSFNSLYKDYNIIIYNIYDIIFFLYFFYLFWKFSKTTVYKKWIVFHGIAFTVITIINVFFQEITIKPLLINYTYGSIALIIIVFLYLNEINWHQNKHVPSINIMFWIGWGLVIFHTGYTMIRAYSHFKVPTNPENYLWIRRFHLLLIVVMYSCFIVGFIKMKKGLKRQV